MHSIGGLAALQQIAVCNAARVAAPPVATARMCRDFIPARRAFSRRFRDWKTGQQEDRISAALRGALALYTAETLRF